MSKLPNHTLWARATTSAASPSSRATSSMLAKSHASQGVNGQHGRRAQRGARPSASTPCTATNSSGSGTPQHAHTLITSLQAQHSADPAVVAAAISALTAAGAVTAPYYGPQPAAVVEAFDHQQAQQSFVTPHEAFFLSSLHAWSTSPLSSTASFTPSFTSFNSRPHNTMLSASSLRGIVPSTLIAPRAQRPLHVWSHAQSPANTGSLSTSGQRTSEAIFSHRVVKSGKSRRKGSTRLLFDAAAVDGTRNDVLSRRVNISETDAEQQSEKLEEILATLWSSHQKSSSAAAIGEFAARPNVAVDFTQNTAALLASAMNSLNGATASASPPSRSPPSSPGPTHNDDVGHRTVFGHVSAPPAKLVVTTSAESSLSSPSASDGSASKTAKFQYIAATSSASAPTGSSGALPPQASAPSDSTEQWAKTFNIPRSTKRHDFMFEHGAYGIPKRHPLSSIRSSGAAAAPGSGSERSSPSRDVVPTSKVRAATDMLSAAAEFLVGSQSGSSKNEYRPFKGRDALQAALAGGSTAEGHELLQPYRSGSASSSAAKGGSSKEGRAVHRMAIRGPDGRIIKDRLRSVQVGEDAYFLRPDALGVADGVGGWASRPGADPALFSRLLMHFSAVELSRYDGLSASELAADNGSLLKAWASVDPVEVMHRAWERCVRASRREGILGSSTALIGLLRGDELRIANMGDCVLMIIRRGEMLFRSTEQQHSFNFPVQLGMMGDTTDTIKKHVMATQQTRDRAVGEGEVASGALEDYDDVEDDQQGASGAAGQRQQDPPLKTDRSSTTPRVTSERESNGEQIDEPDWDEPRRDAGRWTVRVEAGDIIVVGSDGLMDNLFDEDIIEEVLRFLPGGSDAQQGSAALDNIDPSNFSPQLVSEALCSRAKAVSEDSRAISSPFQQRAMEEGLNYVGGKHDDISVLVCLVGERDTLDLDAKQHNSGDEDTSESEGGSGTLTPKEASRELFISR